MKITDLDWKPWGSKREQIGSFEGAARAAVDFPNGYGASCLRGGPFYTDNGTYEIGVMHDGSLDYENPVADGDVRGYLSEDDANTVLAEIEALPKKEKANAA